MKYLLILILLTGCVEREYKTIYIIEDPVIEEVVVVPEEPVEDPKPKETIKKYIVAGQSNVGRCDWSYFEDLTGSEIISAYISGAGIDTLINDTDYSKIEGVNARAILFVHGESDSYIGMDGETYIKKVKEYVEFLGGSDLYISTVGFHATGKHEESFTHIRDSTINEAKINDDWFIAFDEAKYFRSWGMLVDDLHFSSDGCMMMMDAFAEQTYKEN
tara:strand:+ start:89 stop:739 length:651 start_codon:yes stop_codon:yes gene_type:complete